MATLISVITTIGSILITPFLTILLCIIFLAAIGKSLGVRRTYVKILLKIFEYGRQNIETVQNRRRPYDDSDDDEGYVEDSPPPEENDNGCGDKQQQQQQQQHANGVARLHNGYIPNGNTLISRDDKLILVPEPQPNNHAKDLEARLSDDEGKTLDQKEKYNLSIAFDYIISGMESIIEDQVTSRFEAEELKNWNLLIRTNRRYEFISCKLTILWMLGFFVRYCFLFPLRVMILCFGLTWLMLTTPLVGLLPETSLKRWVNSRTYLIAFRIMARSLTGIISIHNKEYRPQRGSVCVANHTSPIDVVILSTDQTYSLVCWLTVCTALVGYVPDSDFKQRLNRYVTIVCFGILSNAISSVITYHNMENKPRTGICVANHTSPIDVLVLMCDNCYSLIGQRHGGFLGVLQRALARASPHIWFERSEVRDRHAVANKLKEHVSNPKNPPILIFPEGTCINNTSVMQFKKGSFEVGSVIYPVAIKYDPRFGDAFWNSSRYPMMQYLYMMMTSWAIVCDVWYLPPMRQKDGETAIDFANRVKSVIAKQGGLVDLMWDGQLKRIKPKKEWRERQQEEFSKRLKIELLNSKTTVVSEI